MIDSHVHVWSEDTEAYPFGPHDRVPVPSRAFDAVQLTEAMDRAGVAQALAIQPRVYGYDHAYLFEAARQLGNRLRVMPLLNAVRPGNVEEMEALADHDMVAGFRVIAIGREQARRLLEPPAQRLWTRLTQLGLPVGLLITPEQLPIVETLASREPRLRIVVDHLGGITGQAWALWGPVLRRLSGRPNVYVKVSALGHLSARRFPYHDMHAAVRSVLESFQPSHVLWGSDWPYAVGYGSYEDAIRSAVEVLDSRDHEQVFAGTAATLFGFRPPGDASV